MCLCASAKGHDCHSCGVVARRVFLFFLSLLISTFFGNFPLLSFLLSCRLSSPEVTKNALKTGSRVANTHPSLTPTLTHSHSQTLSYPSRHSLSRSSHKSFAEIKAQVSSRLKFHFNSLLIVIWEGERVRHTHSHTRTWAQFHSPPAPFYTFAVPLQRTKLSIERALARTHTHTPINMSRTHTWPHSHSVERNEMKRRTGRVNVTARNLSMQPAAHAVPLFIRVHELKLCATMTATA